MKPQQLENYLMIAIPKKETTLILGSAGLGKTDIAKRVIKKLGYESIWSHPAVQSPTDFKGFGFPDETKDFAKFLPYDALHKAMTATVPTVWVMDDYGQGSLEVQKATMQLIWGGNINGIKISDKVTFLLLSNRKEDKAGVTGILEPVKSRVRLINLCCDTNDWIVWAEENNMPSELIAFIQWQPQFLYDFKPTMDLVQTPNPRNVEKVGRGMSCGYPVEMEHEIFAGDCGEAFATGFCSFLKIYHNMVSPMQLLADPSKYSVPNSKESVAIHFALARALAVKAEKKWMDNIGILADKFPPEFSTLMMSLIIRTKPELKETAAYVTWAVKNGNNMI